MLDGVKNMTIFGGLWNVLAIIAIVSLLFYWRGRNAVWGGLTLGIFVGLIWATVSALLGNGFHWLIIGKCIVIGVLLGLIADWLGKLSDHMRKRTKQ